MTAGQLNNVLQTQDNPLLHQILTQESSIDNKFVDLKLNQHNTDGQSHMYVTGSAKNYDYYKIFQSMFVNDDVQLQYNKYVGSPLGSSSYLSDCGHYSVTLL